MRRRRWLVPVVLAVALTSCDVGWLQGSYGPDRRAFNAGERRLTPANVGRLVQTYVLPASGGGTPVVAGGIVVVHHAFSELQTVAGHDAVTGAERWTIALPGPLNGGPFIEGDTVRLSTGPVSQFGQSSEAAYDLRTGEQRVDPILTPGPMVARRGGSSIRQVTVADAGGGPATTYLSVSGRAMSGRVATAQRPALYGPDLVFVPHAEADPVSGAPAVVAYDPDVPCPDDRCVPVWTRELAGVGSLALADGTLYVSAPSGDALGGVTALDAQTGAIVWEAPEAGTSLAVSDDAVYVGSGNSIVALDRADGHVLWRNDVRSHHSIVVAGDVVYAGNILEVTAYDAAGCGAATCQPIWQHFFGWGAFPTGLAVTGGRLHVSTWAGVRVFAVPS